MSPDFYRAFEDRHRGPRADVQARQRVYLPFLDGAAQAGVPRRLVDLGCGRGEWIELAAKQGWQARGVDLDEGMLGACRDAGLDAVHGDLLAHLRTLESASLGALTALQVAEHLAFDDLQALVREAARVLAPGGLLVLETPNPENLVVGSSGFHMDPTHVKPLPPALLSFLAEYGGFAPVAVLRLHEGIGKEAPVNLIDVLAGVSPDYAVVARKPGGQTSPGLDALFAQKHGFNLNELAERYDARLRELERRLQVAEGVKERAVAELFDLRKRAQDADRRAQDADQRVQAIHASTSWRLTAPVRLVGARIAESRRHGARAFVRGILQRLRGAAQPQAAQPAPPPPPPPPQLAPAPAPVPMTEAARGLFEGVMRARRKPREGA